jgi:hypothetical protein
MMHYEAPRLPLILYHLHHYLLAMEVQKGWMESGTTKEFIELPVSIDSLRSALVGSGVELSFDYERLETLGDSFLKFYLALHYFVLFPHRNEGNRMLNV